MRKILELKQGANSNNDGIAASPLDKLGAPRNDFAPGEVTWNDFAVLVRANDSAKPFIHQAELLAIPYQFLASRGLYNKPVISQIIAFLKLLDNYRESSAMYKFLMAPVWGITAYQIADISYHAKKKTLSLYEACEHI